MILLSRALIGKFFPVGMESFFELRFSKLFD
jgi:hypothetical protein